MTHIGQLEILRLRVYPLDAESRDDTRSTVVVEPGIFPSRRFGPDEWAELIAGPEFAEGPDQRLRLTLFDGGES